MHILKVLKWKIRRWFPWRIVNTNKQARMKSDLANELNRAFMGFGAPFDLLAAIGSYGDTLPDDEILALLADFNETGSTYGEIICAVDDTPKDRRERFEMTTRRRYLTKTRKDQNI